MNWKHKLLLPLTKAKAVAQRTYKRLWQYKGRQLHSPLTILRHLIAESIIFPASCIIFLATWMGYGADQAKYIWRYLQHKG